MQVEPHDGPLPAEHSDLSVTPANVLLTAVKKAEDENGLIFRVFEWDGNESEVTFTVPPGGRSATETDLMERPIGMPFPLVGDRVTIPIHPYEILSVRVDYARAILRATSR